jgi:SAM-dependent methyltransferase
VNVYWLIASFVILSFGLGAFLGAPWVPAFRRDLDDILDLAGVTKRTKFVDLGCGDGKVLVAAARRGAHVTGYEVNPIMWLIAKIRMLPFGARAHVYLRSYWSVSMSHYDVIYMFLISHHMPKMRRKLQMELSSGARVVSYMFEFSGIKPSRATSNAFLYEPEDLGKIR